MPRKREIKFGFFQNDLLTDISPCGRLMFQGMWCLADFEGRLLDRPKRIKAAVMPYDNFDFEADLEALEKNGFIHRYTVNEISVIEICNFTKHQNLHPNEKLNGSAIPREDGSVPQVTDNDKKVIADKKIASKSRVNRDKKRTNRAFTSFTSFTSSTSFNYPKPLAGLVGKLDEFAEHRRDLKKPMTERAAILLIGQLEKFAGEGHDVSAMIDTAIVNGWQSVHPPKNFGSTPAPAEQGTAGQDAWMREMGIEL